MTAEMTAYEHERDRINRTEWPRWQARVDALKAARGGSEFDLYVGLDLEPREEVERIWQEESDRTTALIQAIPEELLTEREIILYRREGPEHDEGLCCTNHLRAGVPLAPDGLIPWLS